MAWQRPIEEQLQRVQRRVRLERVLVLAGLVALAVLLGLLALGMAIERGRLHSGPGALGLLIVLLALGLLAGVAAAVAGVLTRRPRGWLARRVEGLQPELRERLLTLTYLEPVRGDARLEPYARRIERQAADVLVSERLSPAVSLRRAGLLWLLALALGVGEVFLLVRARPWQKLSFNPMANGGSRPLELPTPGPGEVETAVDAAEDPAGWGEVRITEPGRDLQVTKVDAVPLQIEVAASAPLGSARWWTANGGAPAQAHALPAPAEPHYAIYTPTLYVDELRLADWDVVSYYAQAAAGSDRRFTSEVYFLEVRPFREDLLRLPGGEGGRAYRLFSELSALIERQKHVLRESHAFRQRRYERGPQRAQDQERLARAEGDLEQAARHLYARIAAEHENQPVAEVLDHLARAQTQLAAAAGALRADEAGVPGLQQQALTELVATRKRLQKAVSDTPTAFTDPSDDQSSTQDAPAAAGQLERIAEYRNEDKAVRAGLTELSEEQRRLAADVTQAFAAHANGGLPHAEAQALADRQRQLGARLRALREAHARAFQERRQAAEAATHALERAATTLQPAPGEEEDEEEGQSQAAASGALELAERALAALNDSFDEASGVRRLADAYRLRRLLAQSAGALDGLEHAPKGEAARVAQQARQASRELKDIVEQTPTGAAFGPALHEALADAAQRERERRLEGLAGAEGELAQRQAAQASRASLDDLTRAFDASQPAVSRQAQARDALREEGAEALDRARRGLAALAQEQGQARPDEARRRRAILEALEAGLDDLKGHDPVRTRALLQRARQELEARQRADGKSLAALLDEIEHLRAEASRSRLGAGDRASLRHIDPTSLPAGYRERIERYLRALAEQSP